MAIIQRNFTTNPGNRNTPDPNNIPDDPTKKTPKDRKKEQLLKQKTHIEKRLEKLNKKTFLANKIREIAYNLQYKKAQDDPNDDPQNLYNQISTNLGKLGLKGRIDKGKGDILIFLDKKKGDEYLYQVKIRRSETIDKKTIDRFDREKFVDSFKWDSDAILLYLWGPYTLPITEEKAIPETEI